MADADEPREVPPAGASDARAAHLEGLLRAFAAARAALPAPPAYAWAWTYDGREAGDEGAPHIGASALIHGDEVGPLEGLLDVMEALSQGKLSFRGRLTCLLGNPEAARAGRRFLEDDLNRVFRALTPEEEAAGAAALPTHEARRAQELAPLLDSFDLYVDFHQTILPTAQPFYICPWSGEGWRWARLMGGARAWVTRHPARGGGGLACADERVRLRGKPSLALELGALGFSPEARAAVWRSLSRAFRAVDSLSGLRGADRLDALDALARAQPELKFYETTARAPLHDPRAALRPGWVNFSEVREGELLSPPGAAVEVRAPASGALLFPKYPPRDAAGAALHPAPSELFRVVSPLTDHPLALWGEG